MTDCICGNPEGTNKECERCRLIAENEQLKDDVFDLKQYRTRYWTERGCCPTCGGALDGQGVNCKACRRVALDAEMDSVSPEQKKLNDAMERGDSIRGSAIPRTVHHDAVAFARCSYCGRYSDNPRSLQYDPYRLKPDDLKCDCGQTRGWSGSFVEPDSDSVWSDGTR